jgi:hypothetical protein
MKTTKASRSRAASDESSLCQFPFADGRQCRMLRHASHPTLCLFHAREEQQLLELDHIGDELASLSGDFRTVADIQHVVGKLFKLVAANRIPVRNARLLAYLAQLLFHGQADVKRETIRAQNYRGWEEVLRTVYPPTPRTAPAPFSKTPHRQPAPPDATPPASATSPNQQGTPASG